MDLPGWEPGNDLYCQSELGPRNALVGGTKTCLSLVPFVLTSLIFPAQGRLFVSGHSIHHGNCSVLSLHNRDERLAVFSPCSGFSVFAI